MTAEEVRPHSELNDGTFHVRPRFKYTVHLTAEALEKRLTAALANSGASCTGKVIPGHATLRIPISERQYWSPQLQLSFEEEEDGLLVRGLFGPRPQVWTMFVLFYSIIGFLAFILLVVGMSMMTLGKSLAIFWGVPVLALLFISLYLVAYIGQRKSRHQMIILYRFLEACTETGKNALQS